MSARYLVHFGQRTDRGLLQNKFMNFVYHMYKNRPGLLVILKCEDNGGKNCHKDPQKGLSVVFMWHLYFRLKHDIEAPGTQNFYKSSRRVVKKNCPFEKQH